MKLKVITQEFCVCKINDVSQVDFSDEYCFVGKTDEELSLVCSSDNVPANTIESEYGWRAFRIEGVLDFSLIGILSEISTILANNKIGIFAISTFNTDYILTKKEKFNMALDVLKSSGYIIE